MARPRRHIKTMTARYSRPALPADVLARWHASEQAIADTAGEQPTASSDGPSGRPAAPAPDRPDPTRYGDWEHNGRCIDF